jgi:uncharacterized protein (TIGR01244 family)
MPRQLDDKTLISGQISAAEVNDWKRHGVTLIVNNRPDGEDSDQPTSAEIEAAVTEAGMAYRHVPIRRGMGPADVEAMHEAIEACGDGRMLAFCRSGYRSALAWAVARSEAGAPRAEIEAGAAQAGIDLGPVAHLL